MNINAYKDAYPSEHTTLRLFGVTLFDVYVAKFYRERTLSLTLLGFKVQVTWEKDAERK